MAGLHNVDLLYDQLRSKPNLIVIDAKDGAAIYRLFMNQPLPPGTQLSPDDLAFLQAAMMAAIDGTSALEYVRDILGAAYKPAIDPDDLKDILKDLGKATIRYLFRNLRSDKDIANAKVMKATVDTIKLYNRVRFMEIGNPT